MEPQELFDLLLNPRRRRLISYIDAYEQLFGVRPNPFRNHLDVPPVIQAAKTTQPREFHGLTIRLDALIVRIADHRPGDNYFTDHPEQTLQMWQNFFGNWELF